MKQKLTSLLILLAISALSISCMTQEASGASNETSGNSASSGGAVVDQASLMAALQAAGAEVDPGDPIEQPFFSVEGQILRVNGADVQVFEYETEEALGTEASQVSKDGSSIGTSMVSWVEAPHFFRSGRVLVLYVGEDAVLLDLLRSVLGDQFAGR